MNENKQIPEFREQSRKKALSELQVYREELLQQLEQLKTEETSASEKGKVKRLGTHPGAGNFFTNESSEEPELDDTWMEDLLINFSWLLLYFVLCSLYIL